MEESGSVMEVETYLGGEWECQGSRDTTLEESGSVREVETLPWTTYFGGGGSVREVETLYWRRVGAPGK